MMMDSGDLNRPCRVQVADGYKRPISRLFRKTPVWRTVYNGFIDSVSRGPNGARMEIGDAMSRLSRVTFP